METLLGSCKPCLQPRARFSKTVRHPQEGAPTTVFLRVHLWTFGVFISWIFIMGVCTGFPPSQQCLSKQNLFGWPGTGLSGSAEVFCFLFIFYLPLIFSKRLTKIEADILNDIWTAKGQGSQNFALLCWNLYSLLKSIWCSKRWKERSCQKKSSTHVEGEKKVCFPVCIKRTHISSTIPHTVT